MKLLILLGSGAVGKMTVGQELAKITDLRLFHNHMTIEPVLEIFGKRNGRAVDRLRDVIFEEFAASDNYGMIFTFMMAFDQPSEWEYLEHIRQIFEPYGTEFYYVELVADKAERLRRNGTENRLANKPSKRNVEWSNRNILHEDSHYRLVSNDGEIPFENYIKIDNTCLAPDAAANMIKEKFSL